MSEVSLFTVTFCANSANDLTCPPLIYYNFQSAFWIAKYTRPAVEDRLGGRRVAMFWSYPRPILRDASFVVTRTRCASSVGARGAGGAANGGAASSCAAPRWAVRAAPMACSFSGEDGRTLISFARFKGTTVRHAWALCDEEMKSAAPQCWETPIEYHRAEQTAADARCLAGGGYGDGEEEDSFASCDDDDDDDDDEDDEEEEEEEEEEGVGERARESESERCGAEAAAVHHHSALDNPNAEAKATISFVCPEIVIDLNAAMNVDLSRPMRVVGDRVDKLLARVTLRTIAFTNEHDGELASALSFGRIAIRDPEVRSVLFTVTFFNEFC